MTEGHDAEAAAEIGAIAASLFQRGLTHGRTGNISVRLRDGGVLLTPSGCSLGSVAPDRLSRLDPSGAHVGGDKPSKEAFLHLAMYRARPTAGAVVHTHSTYAAAVSCLTDVDRRDVLPPLTAYYAMRVGTLPLLPYHRPGDPALGPVAQAAAAEHSALLLANHGPVLAAADLAAAADAAEELEETAKLYLLLRGLPTSPLTADQVRELRARTPR